MTLPFNLNSDFNIELSKTDPETKELVHRDQPVWYPHPLDPNAKRLCYYHFGWEFMDEMVKKGFTNVSTEFIWSLYYGFGR